MQGTWRKMKVDGQPRFAGYLLCVIILLEAATIEQTSGAESLGLDSEEMMIQQPVRRHAFSVTHDLQTLTKMLNDETERHRMQSAEAFFNALHKRRLPLKQPLSTILAKKMIVGLRGLHST